MGDEFKKAELGSNTFINTDKLIYYENRNGKFINLFELKKNNQDFLITAEVRDENGKFLGKLYKNNFVPSTDKSLIQGREFESKRLPNKFWLKDGENVLVCVKALNDDWIINGLFHVKLGVKEKTIRIEITDTDTKFFECIESEDAITKEKSMDFVNRGTYSNNNIVNMGGIKLSYEDDMVNIRLGFLNN